MKRSILLLAGVWLRQALLSLVLATTMLAPSMAEAQRVSALPAATSPPGSELIPCVQGGVTKSCKLSQISSSLGAGPTYSYAPLPTLSVVPAAVYCVVKCVDSYAGPLYTLTTDEATPRSMDVYPLPNGLPDYSAIDSWVAKGNTATVTVTPYYSTVYDESGNARNATQSTASARPFFSPTGTERGVRPINFQLHPDEVRRYLSVPAITGLDKGNFGFYQVTSFGSIGQSGTQLAFANSGATGDLFALSDGFGVSPTGQTALLSSAPAGRLSGVGYSNSVANTLAILSIDNQVKTTASASAAGAMSFGATINGNTLASSSGISNGFATIIYATAPSAADIAALNTWATAAFKLPTPSYTRAIAIDGNSLTVGRGQSLNQMPARMEGWADTTKVTTFGVIAQTLATCYSQLATMGPRFFTAGVPNVLVAPDPTNDIYNTTFTSQADAVAWVDAMFAASAGTFSGGTADNTLYKYLALGKTQGYGAIVVPTVIGRGGFTNANFKTYAQAEYNAQVRAMASTLGYTVFDAAAVSVLIDATNTAWFYTDQVHPLNTGAQFYANARKAAINAAFAAIGAPSAMLDIRRPLKSANDNTPLKAVA
jgi:hypothetical protein